MGISAFAAAGTFLAASSVGSTLDVHVTTTSDQVQAEMSTNVRGAMMATAHWNNGDVTATAHITVGPAVITFEKNAGQPATFNVSGLSVAPSGPNRIASTDMRLLASTHLTSRPLAAGALDDITAVASAVLNEIALWFRTIIPFLLLGLLLMLLLPRLGASVRGTAANNPWERLGIGVITLIAVPSAAIALLVAGIFLGVWWLGLLLIALYGVALAAGYAFSGLVVGRTVSDRLGWASLPMFWALLFGLALLSLLTIVPYLGAFVAIIAACYGMGALLLAPRTPETTALPPRFLQNAHLPLVPERTPGLPTGSAGAGGTPQPPMKSVSRPQGPRLEPEPQPQPRPPPRPTEP